MSRSSIRWSTVFAVAVLETLTAAYGKPANAIELAARISEVASLPPLTETVETLLKTPPPIPGEIKKYLGEWEGEAWVNDAPRHPIRLRVFLEGDTAKSELIHFPDPETVLRMPGEHLKISEHGLSFGHMNGMYPRGVIIFDGRFHDDILEGESQIRGVRFSYPEGIKPPVHRFTLKRKR